MIHESLAQQPRGMRATTFGLVVVAATVLVWMNLRVAGAIREMNLDPIRATPLELDSVTHYMFFRGWPLSPYAVCVFHGMKFHPDESPVRFVLVLDFAVAGMVLFGVAVLSEWFIRRRTVNVRG
jgi:hypothetical protein